MTLDKTGFTQGQQEEIERRLKIIHEEDTKIAAFVCRKQDRISLNGASKT